MRVAIHQPMYFPYPGFFHKLSLVDAFVLMDDVQYDRRFTNRNRILVPQGPTWLSVPIDKEDRFLPNRSVRINNALPWRSEHYRKISLSYTNTPFYRMYKEYFEELFAREWNLLLDLDLDSLRRTMEWLSIRLPIILESELNIRGRSTERLVAVCKAVGAETYVSGRGGRAYINERLFSDNGIKLEYQNYEPVAYPQRHREDFVPDMSVIDMLCNVGPDSRRLISESSGKQEDSAAASRISYPTARNLVVNDMEESTPRDIMNQGVQGR